MQQYYHVLARSPIVDYVPLENLWNRFAISDRRVKTLNQAADTLERDKMVLCRIKDAVKEEDQRKQDPLAQWLLETGYCTVDSGKDTLPYGEQVDQFFLPRKGRLNPVRLGGGWGET